MRSVSFTFIFLLSQAIALAQPCLQDDITFSTQAQIDSFPINYPNCTEIEGNVLISGDDISNLDSLIVLTLIWSLNIENNPSLISLAGLNNLNAIHSGLVIKGNDALVNLSGLGNLVIGSIFRVSENSALQSLDGLDRVSWHARLFIHDNISLTSLLGLDVSSGIIYRDLFITGNISLSECEAQIICFNLPNPFVFTMIVNNDIGCSSPEEVQDSCEANAVSVEVRYILEECMISPNPFTTSTTLSYNLSEPSTVAISIFNPQGQLIEMIVQDQPKGEQRVQWNAEGLPAGMYYFRIQAGDLVGGGEMVKMR